MEKNIIVEDYCSFEVSKLLKEKGFDGLCRRYDFEDWQGRHTDTSTILPSNFNKHGGNTSIPTLQMAMKWLREVHKLHVEIYRSYDYGTDADNRLVAEWWCWSYKIVNIETASLIYIPNDDFDTHEEAVEAALKYSLENLI